MSKGRYRDFGWIVDAAILLGAAIILRGPAIGIAEIDWDESNFALVAREILHGRWPYSAVFDHKPIALFLHYAAALALFGDNPIAVRLLGILTVTTCAIIVRQIALHRLGNPRGSALALAACTILATLGYKGQAVYSEHLVNLYLLLSVLLLTGRRRRFSALLGGLAAGIAFNVNYLAVPVIAGMIGAHSLWRRNGLNSLAWFIVGGIAASALVLLPIALFGDLPGYFAQQLRFLSGYSAHRSMAGTLAEFAVQGAPLLPVFASAGALAFLRADSHDPYPRLFAGMAAGSLVAVLASGYVYPHYLLLAVPPALLLVASLSVSASKELQIFSAVIVGGTALMLGLPGLVLDAVGLRNLVHAASGDESGDLPRQLARVARVRVEPGQTIYSVCAPLVLYQLLDARPPTRYPMFLFSLDPQYASALGINMDAEIAGIFAKRPAIVVIGNYDQCWGIPQSSWRKVRDALQRNRYTPFAQYAGYWLFAPSPPARTAATR